MRGTGWTDEVSCQRISIALAFILMSCLVCLSLILGETELLQVVLPIAGPTVSRWLGPGLDALGSRWRLSPAAAATQD